MQRTTPNVVLAVHRPTSQLLRCEVHTVYELSQKQVCSPWHRGYVDQLPFLLQTVTYVLFVALYGS